MDSKWSPSKPVSRHEEAAGRNELNRGSVEVVPVECENLRAPQSGAGGGPMDGDPFRRTLWPHPLPDFLRLARSLPRGASEGSSGSERAGEPRIDPWFGPAGTSCNCRRDQQQDEQRRARAGVERDLAPIGRRVLAASPRLPDDTTRSRDIMGRFAGPQRKKRHAACPRIALPEGARSP